MSKFANKGTPTFLLANVIAKNMSFARILNLLK
jgi:hypothetical protein